MTVIDVRGGVGGKIEGLRCSKCRIPLTVKDTVLWCAVDGCRETAQRFANEDQRKLLRMDEKEPRRPKWLLRNQ